MNLVTPGLRFDDGRHLGVKQLVIRHASRTYNFASWLLSIDIKYHDGNGISTSSGVHGCQIPDLPTAQVTMIKLDYPNEYLTAICGYVDIPWPHTLPWVTAIRSIFFRSNKRMYGPFGDPVGRFFAEAIPETMIVGFYGCSLPMYGLLQIKAHMKPLESHQICPPKDLLPAPSCRPPQDLIPALDSLQIKVKKDEDDNTNEHSTCVVSNNQISKNHGDGNGSLSVGNRIKYIVNQYS